MTTTLLGRLHSTRQAATDARHTRERRPLHSRHTREGGYPAVRRGIRPVNSASPPRRRRTGRSLSPAGAPFSSTSDPVDSGSGAGMTTTLLGRLHSARRAATDARHTRERRPLHSRHTREGGYPAVRRGIRPINSVSPPRCRRPGRSFVAGRGAIQLDLPPRRFRLGGRNDDYSTQQATLHSAGGHRRPSYPRKETFAQPSYPRRRESSGPKRHSSHQQRLAASTSAHGAVICRRQGAIQLDLPPRRFRLGGRNDDYSTRHGYTPLGRRPQTPVIPAKGDLCTTVIPAQAGIQRSEAAFVPSTLEQLPLRTGP